MVIDEEHGTIDSPLNSDHVDVYPGVPEALLLLNSKGYGLSIVSNQPAAAKGKTTRKNLEAVHEKIVQIVQSKGAVILSSHICFHRAEDLCACRKPKTGLLEDALRSSPAYKPEDSWMVGDGVTDIQAGQLLNLKTAFLGPEKWDAKKVFEELGIRPTFWAQSLGEFARWTK